MVRVGKEEGGRGVQARQERRIGNALRYRRPKKTGDQFCRRCQTRKVDHLASGRSNGRRAELRPGAVPRYPKPLVFRRRPQQTTEYVHGTKQGKDIRYHRGNHKSLEVEYSNGVKDGHYLEWYANTKLKTDRTYEDGTLEGPYTEWHADGSLKTEGEYVDGIRDGSWKEWWPEENGHNPKTDLTYEDGTMTGVSISWYRNGKKKAETNYDEDGNKSGLATEWYENGQRKSECLYDSNLPNGRMITWYMSGEPKGIIEYRLGRKEGMSYDWKESGDVVTETMYHAGVAEKKQ